MSKKKVPLSEIESRRLKTSVNIPVHILEELDRVSNEMGVTRSAAIIWFCAAGIAAHDKSKVGGNDEK